MLNGFTYVIFMKTMLEHETYANYNMSYDIQEIETIDEMKE